MNTIELIAKVAESQGLTKKAVEGVITAVADAINNEVKGGGEVVIKDIGRFFSAQRAARVCRNPQNGEPIQVPAKTVVKFASRGALKN